MYWHTSLYGSSCRQRCGLGRKAELASHGSGLLFLLPRSLPSGFVGSLAPLNSLRTSENPENPATALPDAGAHLEVLQGLLQAAVVVQHHPPELQGLHMVLVQQQGLLEALSGCFEIAQFSED